MEQDQHRGSDDFFYRIMPVRYYQGMLFSSGGGGRLIYAFTVDTDPTTPMPLCTLLNVISAGNYFERFFIAGGIVVPFTEIEYNSGDRQ